jgi:hypothetical protein
MVSEPPADRKSSSYSLKIRREFQLSPFVKMEGNVSTFDGINLLIFLFAIGAFLHQNNLFIQHPRT